MTGALNKADTKRLRDALDELPDDLVYLRDVILDVARQNQDMLGSGDGDASAFDRAWSEQSAVSNADDHAESLERWAGQFDRSAAWLGPVWWIIGQLRGVALFGPLDGDDGIAEFDVPPEPELPPQVALRVPAGMKLKRHKDVGWELSDRTVLMTGIELTAQQFQGFCEQYAMIADGRLPSAPGVVNEFTPQFKGSTVCSAVRVTKSRTQRYTCSKSPVRSRR